MILNANPITDDKEIALENLTIKHMNCGAAISVGRGLHWQSVRLTCRGCGKQRVIPEYGRIHRSLLKSGVLGDFRGITVD